jgi:hypothetical protein
MARNGKIAHLPRHIRNELNRRLADSEPGSQILEWLNGLEEVQHILDESFDGQPINEPNLSAWRHGGFLEWQRYRESCEWVRAVSDETDQIGEEAGLMPLSDRLSTLAGLALGKFIRNLEAGSAAGSDARQEFHALMKDLTQLRREDREAARLRIELERHAKAKAQEQRAARAAAAYCAATGWHETMAKLRSRHPSPPS